MLRSSPLFQLYLVRLRDFYRQPARVFWVYGFPTLLAIALGFAFQNRPPAPLLVDLVEGPAGSQIKAHLEEHNAALEREKQAGKPRQNVPSVEIHEAPAEEALKRLNTGKTPLVIEPLGSEVVDLSLRPDAARRQRGPSDDRRHLAASRRSHQPGTDERRLRQRAGLTLHRLPDPGLDRAERHGGRALGHRLSARQLPHRQIAQAVRGHAHAPARFLARPPGGPAHVRDP